jgi:hypothetical protein
MLVVAGVRFNAVACAVGSVQAAAAPLVTEILSNPSASEFPLPEGRQVIHRN